jgi:catechol 2,3-dioxygenase
MAEVSIPPESDIGKVALTVSDIERSINFYTQSLGLVLFGRDGKTARLGAGQNEFLEVTEVPGARYYPRTTGLYHFAILVPSRIDLARVIQHLAETGTPLGGAADHLVSEALYLADPDENGIEIYRDRPRSEWRISNGQVQMATDPLDFDGILSELKGQFEEWQGIAPETRMGHIHLKVADVEESIAFYCGVLGFELMARYGPSAAFVSAGGYHHHIGMNTWESRGAPPPPADAVGLRYYAIRLRDAVNLEQVAERLSKAGIPMEDSPEGIFLRDPSKNRILLAQKRF